MSIDFIAGFITAIVLGLFGFACMVAGYALGKSKKGRQKSSRRGG